MQNQEASNGVFASKWAHRLLWAVYLLIALSFLVTRPLVGFALVFLAVWSAGKAPSDNLRKKFLTNLKAWRSEKVRIGMTMLSLFVALIFSIPISSIDTTPITEPVIVFDVPSVFEMTMVEVRAAYGEPVNETPYPTEESLSYGTTEWTQAFQSSGYRMAVTYEIDTDLPIKVFISRARTENDLSTSWIRDVKEERDELVAISGLESGGDDDLNFYCGVDELYDLEEPMCTGFEVRRY